VNVLQRQDISFSFLTITKYILYTVDCVIQVYIYFTYFALLIVTVGLMNIMILGLDGWIISYPVRILQCTCLQ